MPTVCNTIAGVLGNALEWYDFALFGFFSDIIAKVFFPPHDGEDNLIKSFAIFGGAFVMRPIGGLIIGYVGDKHGRKVALTGSLILMAIPTFTMGFLPTYDQIGYWAPVLLLLCRLLQGVSVGGQLTASLVYTVEMQPKENWGLYGSYPMVAANCGSLMGNLVGATVRQALTEEQLVSYGWRIPFYTGILIGFVGLYLHLYGEDVHPNADAYNQNSEHKNPIRKACMSGNRLALISVWFTAALWAAGYYITFIWMAIYMETLLQPSIPNAFWVNACSLFFGCTFLLIAAGALSDRLGRYPVMVGAAIGLFVWGPVTVYIIGSTKNAVAAFFTQWLLGCLVAFFGGPLCSWLVETFDPDVRLTSVSLGFDMAHATASGFSPAIATLLFERAGQYSPGLLYPLWASLSLFGLYLMYGHERKYGIDTTKSTPTTPPETDVPSVGVVAEENPTEDTAPDDTELPEVS